ncbi:MAG: DUF4860 domain-containing protein [Lachnospiraceae bacterium]|nr:DUF4860 domain-containing protein [Lachnospiraceae bacterium]
MQTKQGHRHIVDLLFVLALFALFALSGILLILLGAGVYRKNVEQSADNYALRTTGAYLTEKIRRTDMAGSIETGTFDGRDALILREDVNGISYSTYLYLRDGYLTELFARSDLSLPSSAGRKILRVEELSFDFEDDHLLRIRITEENGFDHTVVVALRADPAGTSSAEVP